LDGKDKAMSEYATTPMHHTKRRGKKRRCNWCGQAIEIGERYATWAWYDDGSRSTVYCHVECETAWLMAAFDNGGYAYADFDQERPNASTGRLSGCTGSGEAACSPFQDGQLSFLAGIVVGKNPHPEDSEAHWQWMAGWADQGMKRIKTKTANNEHTEAEGRP
jgi:hypothetical protein